MKEKPITPHRAILCIARKEREVRKVCSAIICMAIAAATSVIVTKILATHYFEIVDGYVKDMCSKTKEFVDSIKRRVQ